MKLAAAHPPLTPTPAPTPAPGYPQRLRAWVRSSDYALVGAPFFGAALTCIPEKRWIAVAVFAGIAIVAALAPPIFAGLHTAAFTARSLLAILLATAVVIVVLTTTSAVGALVAALVLVVLVGLAMRSQPGERLREG